MKLASWTIALTASAIDRMPGDHLVVISVSRVTSTGIRFDGCWIP